jgi:hypothetical protein
MKATIFWDTVSSSIMWTDFSEESITSIFRVTYCTLISWSANFRPWRWRWYVPPKRRSQTDYTALYIRRGQHSQYTCLTCQETGTEKICQTIRRHISDSILHSYRSESTILIMNTYPTVFNTEFAWAILQNISTLTIGLLTRWPVETPAFQIMEVISCRFPVCHVCCRVCSTWHRTLDCRIRKRLSAFEPLLNNIYFIICWLFWNVHSYLLSILEFLCAQMQYPKQNFGFYIGNDCVP